MNRLEAIGIHIARDRLTLEDCGLLMAAADALVALVDEGAPTRTHEYAGLECYYCGAVRYATGMEHKEWCPWLLAKKASVPLLEEGG